MKNNLKKITDKTIQDLLQNEIILPSSYFKSFDQNSKQLNVYFDDPEFEKEINNVIVEELSNINNYMKKTVDNIELLSDATNDAQKAIIEKDHTKLETLNFALSNMKKEITALKDSIYLDPLTKTYGRRWIYNQPIDREGCFKNEGTLLFINLMDCDYLTEKYGNLVADNVILYISKLLSDKLKAENYECDIARYSNHQFIVFIKNETISNITSFIKNIRVILGNTTLKSKSGLMFKTSFNFGIVQYDERKDFQNILEKAASISVSEQESIKEQ